MRKINGRRNPTESIPEKKRSWFSVRQNLCVMTSGCPFCHFLTSSFSIDAFLGKSDAGLWWFTPVGSNPKVQMIWLGTATTGVISHCMGCSIKLKTLKFPEVLPFEIYNLLVTTAAILWTGTACHEAYVHLQNLGVRLPKQTIWHVYWL